MISYTSLISQGYTCTSLWHVNSDDVFWKIVLYCFPGFLGMFLFRFYTKYPLLMEFDGFEVNSSFSGAQFLMLWLSAVLSLWMRRRIKRLLLIPGSWANNSSQSSLQIQNPWTFRREEMKEISLLRYLGTVGSRQLTQSRVHKLQHSPRVAA